MGILAGETHAVGGLWIERTETSGARAVVVAGLARSLTEDALAGGAGFIKSEALAAGGRSGTGEAVKKRASHTATS